MIGILPVNPPQGDICAERMNRCKQDIVQNDTGECLRKSKLRVSANIPRSVTPPPTTHNFSSRSKVSHFFEKNPPPTTHNFSSKSKVSHFFEKSCSIFGTSPAQNEQKQQQFHFDRFCRTTASDDWTDDDENDVRSESSQDTDETDEQIEPEVKLPSLLGSKSRYSIFSDMTSVNYRSPTLLFPTKYEKEVLPEIDTPDLPHTVSNEVVETDDEENYPSREVNWKGMTSLEMVQSVTSMVDRKLSLAERRAMKKLAVDTSYLALKTPDLPPTVPELRRNVLNTGPTSGSKRVRDNINDDTAVQNFPMLSSSEGFVPFKIRSWNSFFISEYGKIEHMGLAVEKLQKQICAVEERPNIRQLASSYYRIQDDFDMTAQEIENEPSSNHSDTNNRMISALLDTTIHKMEALVEMSLKLSRSKSCSGSTSTKVLGEFRKNSQPCHVAYQKKECSKRDLAEYMGEWLKKNWTNPYPDDEVLAEISEKCGTSPNVVSNWLINARTRKWRPAIMKAYELGRPSDMLKEDAINIFERKPVRKID